MTLKSGVLSIAEYATCLALYYFMILGVHEYIHLTVLRALHGDGYIILTWYGASVHFTQTPSNFLLVALSGGLGLALIYGLLALWNLKDGDIEEFAVVFPFAGLQLAYGLVEGFLIGAIPFGQFYLYGELASAVGFAIPMFLVLFPFGAISDRFKSLNKINLVYLWIQKFSEKTVPEKTQSASAGVLSPSG
jgi:hypothetical protein